MNRLYKVCVFMLLALIFTGCGSQTELYLEETESEEVRETETEAEGTAPVAEKEPQKTDSAPVVVYVCGEVVKPGVYELSGKKRICDAVEAAGGLTKKASRDYWNLAEVLTDGQMLYFPTAEEARKRQESAEGEEDAVQDGRVNINTADISQLETIPGIGQTRAEAILAYRQENGNFACIEDIMKVSGIKNGLFEKMKDYITVG